MTALTITRTAQDDKAATLTITDAKGRSCSGRFYADGSGRVIEGSTSVYDNAQRSLGKSRVRTAIRVAVVDGSATVEAI